jgi:restriction system protein
VIRAGRAGEREMWALNNGVSGGGWKEMPDLTSCTTKDEIAELVLATFPSAKPGKVNNFILGSCSRSGRASSPATCS